LRREAETASGRLLRVLFVWQCEVPTKSNGRAKPNAKSKPKRIIDYKIKRRVSLSALPTWILEREHQPTTQSRMMPRRLISSYEAIAI